MATIRPTPGRVLHYYHKATDQFARPMPGQPLPAIVTAVWSDTCVNVAIFDANGNAVLNPPTSVLLVQPGQEAPTGGGYCCWPSLGPPQHQQQAASPAEQAAGGA